MSFRYMSERYPSNHRNEPPLSSFHGERNFPRSRRSSPYFRDDYEDRYSSSKYPLEGRHISDHRMRDRSLSPRDRRRSQEPDLRDYLVASQYNRKLSDVEREGPNYNRTYGDYEMLNQTPDWKYDRNIDMKARMDKESIDLRNRELATRRDYRDDKYSFGSERDRRFPDLREELNNSRRGRYSPDRRDEIYLSEPRRDDNFDYRDKLYSTASRLEKYSSDFREESHFRRDRTSPDRRFLGDHRDQPNYREFMTESDRHRPIRDGLPIKEFVRDWQHPGQSHQDYSYAPGRDSRYPDPSTNHWRDQYPEERYERPYNTPQRMMPVSNDRSHNEFNQQGPRMDYRSEDNWRNGHPHWNDRGSTFNKNIPEPDNRRMASFPHVNNAMQQQSELVNTPFLNNGSLPANISEGDEALLPRFTVLIQNLNNIHEPFSEEHIEYVKKAILAHWSEEKINRTKGNWLPSFLDCIPWRNGLAIVCQNKRSMSWLLKKKIKGYDGFFFAATNAATPIKKVKLWIQVPGVDLNPTQVLRKFQQCNRGHQIRFDRFKVVNSKEHNNGLNMIVLSDSWTVNKLHKRLNWRPRYGDRRIRIKVLGKKRTKPPSTKPGEVKKLNDEPDFDLMDEDSQSESYDEL